MLFGGAITSHLIQSLYDVSSVRPLPDTQEQFVNPKTGQSLTIDIMCMLEHSIEQSINVFLKDLITHPEIHITVNNTEYFKLQCEYEHICLKCEYKTEYKDKTKFDVFKLAVLRLKNANTDLLVYTLTPVAEQSNAFEETVQTLKVEDWGLFGGEAVEE